MYQLRISAPLKIVKNVPRTKNGANGTLVFAFTFFIESTVANLQLTKRVIAKNKIENFILSI